MLDEAQRATTTGRGSRVFFYMRPKQDDAATVEAGRPIYKMLEYVRIEPPGDKTLIIDKPVSDDHRAQFRPQYEAFKQDRDQDAASGTLLSATGLIRPERVEELKHFRIRTVEQYAAVPDSNIQNLGIHSTVERQHCRDFLEAAKSNAPILRLQQQLDDASNEKETMKRQLSELQARVESLIRGKPSEETEDKAWGDETTKKRGPGRPPRAQAEAT